VSTECEEFSTRRDVYSSILQAHSVFINSEPSTSDSFERTDEHSYKPNYESNVSSNKTMDHFIISNENSLEPKQNETQFKDVSDGITQLQKRRSRSKSLGLAFKAPAVLENRRDYRGRKF